MSKYKRPKKWKKIKSEWIGMYADNGWLDWICPKCNTKVLNEDVHVHLDWTYCPYCGEKNIETIEEMTEDEYIEQIEKELKEQKDDA